MIDENEFAVHPDLAGEHIQVAEKPAHLAPIEPEEQVTAPLMDENKPILEPEKQIVKEDHPNFRSLKEKADRERDRADRERERADRLENEIRRQQQYSQPHQSQAEQEVDERLNEEDLVTGKHISKVEKKYKKEINQMREELAQTKQQIADSVLRANYPDIAKVITADNIRRLAEEEPELAQGLDGISDYTTKVQATYKSLKRLGIYTEDNYEKDRDRVQKNASKPKTLSSISPQQGDSPLARANVFAQTDDSEAAQLKRYEDMMKYAGNR